MKEEIILPDYEHCILNTITSILKYYNVPTKHKSLKSLDKILEKKYKNVVLLILDGMGEHILKRFSKDGFFRKNELECITSVYPSTTTAALTTYYSGKPPYETSWIAWSQYFKEYGRALDMFSQKDSYEKRIYENPTIDVFKTIVNYKTIFEQIEEANDKIKAYEVEPKYAERRSKRTIVADNIDELIDGIKLLCENPGEKFVFAYSDCPDGILHKFGADAEEAKQFVLDAEEKVEKMCKNFDDDTIVIISADHGHKNIEKAYTLLDYPEILDCLIMPASLESRTINFWVKEDKKEKFVEIFNKEFGQEFWLMTKEEFLDEKHLLGFGEKHPKIDDFIGNYIAISTSSSIIRLETFLAEGKPVKKSTHCGITKDEMEVPIIVIKN